MKEVVVVVAVVVVVDEGDVNNAVVIVVAVVVVVVAAVDVDFVDSYTNSNLTFDLVGHYLSMMMMVMVRVVAINNLMVVVDVAMMRTLLTYLLF